MINRFCSTNTLIASAVLCVLCASGAWADLLTNESFELGSLTGWTPYGSSPTCTIQTATPAPGCGAYYLYQMLPTMNSEGGVYQTVTGLTAGATYRISGSKKSMHSDIFVSVKCDTNGGTTYSLAEQTVSAAGSVTSWTSFTGDVTATGTSMTVFLHSSQIGGIKANHVGAFDCVSLSFLCYPPAAPTGVSASPAAVNAGGSSTLSASVESGCTVDWYADGCSGAFAGSGTSLVVTPERTTVYYARARNLANGCLSASCGPAVTVTVNSTSAIVITPSNMADYGWQMATSNGGTGTFTKGGPAVSEYALGPAFPMGKGAFYATCKEIDSTTPSTVWLGLDKLCTGFDQSGNPQFKSLELIRLNQIKKLAYKTYVPTIPTYHINLTELNYPMQPIHVSIVTEDSAYPYLDRNWYVNMPWPYNWNVFHTQDRFGHWDTNQASPWDGTTAGWFCPDPSGKWDTWEEMCEDNSIGMKHLVPTSTCWDPGMPKGARGWKSCGYSEDLEHPENATNPPGAAASTGTGTAINFHVGARDKAADLTAWYNVYFTWWNESFGFRGYLDEVTIGVDFEGDGGYGYVQATYDFEPDSDTPDVRTVAMAQKNAILPEGGVWKLNPLMRSLLLNKGYSGADREAMRIKCVGKVLSYNNTGSAFGVYFDLTDGSVTLDEDNYDPPYPANPEEYSKELPPAGLNLWQRPLPVRVHVPYAAGVMPEIGEYWSVIGYPTVLGWDHPIPDPGHNATEVCGQLYLYSTIENCQKLIP